MRRVRSLVGLITLCLAAQVPAQQASLDQRLRGRLLVGAHRGGMSFEDSNTISRFDWASRHGADIIETDLQVSKDGVPILFHDDTLARETPCRGAVRERTAEEIGKCHRAGLDHGPETFERALAWSNGRVVINAEFKTLDTIEPAIDLVRKHGAYEWVYFQVQDGLERYNRARAYDRRVALLASPRSKALLDRLLALDDPRLIIIELHTGMGITDRDTIDAIHRAGKLVSMNAWQAGGERTRDWWGLAGRRANCTRLYRMGVDIAVTNVPEDCVKQRDAIQGAR